MSFFEPVRIGTNINVLRNATVLESYINNENNSVSESNTHQTNNNSNNQRLCSICQGNYVNGTIIRKIIHCNHFYHQNCLDEWLENNTKCPECQYDIRESVPSRNTNENTNDDTTSNLDNTADIITNILQNRLFSSTSTSNTGIFSNPSNGLFSSIDIIIPNRSGLSRLIPTNTIPTRTTAAPTPAAPPSRITTLPQQPLFDDISSVPHSPTPQPSQQVPQPQPPQPHHQTSQSSHPTHPTHSQFPNYTFTTQNSYHNQRQSQIPNSFFQSTQQIPMYFPYYNRYSTSTSTLNERRLLTIINRLERVVSNLENNLYNYTYF
jgi:hypothetical protein